MSTAAASTGATRGVPAGWLWARRAFPVRAPPATAWAVCSDWRMAWAGLPDVVVSDDGRTRVINGDIFESVVELDDAARTHAWSYDTVPAAWGIGAEPRMHGRVTVVEG